MSDAPPDAVRGRIDAAGVLVAADPPLAALNEAAGGRIGAPIAVPQIAAVARLARRLRIVVSRATLAAAGDADLDIWVRAEPDAEGSIALAITGWTRRARRVPLFGLDPRREADFARAEADWQWEVDGRLRLTMLSAAAAGAVGDTRAFVGEPLTRLLRFAEDANGGLPVLAALAEHRRIDGQIAILRSAGPAAGPDARYRLSAVPMTDGRGRFAGFRGTAIRIEDVLSPPAPEPDTGGAFAARLDEALRQPLGRIVSHAEALRAQDEGPLRAEYTAYAGDIAAAARHLLSLVDDLVDLQAIERPDFRPEAEDLDLADIARRAAGLLGVRAANADVRIDRPAEDESLAATGEFRRVLQILVNLLGNAIRYSPPGSMVWIRSEREGDLAALVVADQGKGIAPEDQARIFDKFERVDPSEPGGTGLGLYIARRLARAMGGDIAVDSAPGQGARFTLTLPAA